MRAWVSAAVALAACALAGCALAGCGLQSGQVIADSVRPGSVGGGRTLAGAHLTVASKADTEQRLLGQITGLVLKAAGATVRDKTGISGSIGARQAILSGTADAMYDYTGTAWITYLGHTGPIPDPQAQWRAVRGEDAHNGVTWLPPATLNNTYAFAVNAANRDRYRLTSLTDVASLFRRDPAAVTICADNEFAIRQDGLPGVLKAYGISLPKARIMTMDAGLIYTQVAAGRPCVLGDVYATDGRIPADRLTVLRDDKHFFPDYNAAPVIHTRTLERYPQIARLLAPVTAKLTTEEARRLNAQVDVDGRDVRDVAKAWLTKKGFIRP
ncbi:glycine betaine ABC transporter substrate-binding protein [Streptomyces sp. RB6PN25]|uniref:Glycine betaine ABC transporter substrate-binding protein n=1 Tax=Streptomyces humicola TaxID=2953240 RepID=A0ABT1Q1Q8_9ACTN|nr:glycine betaine ABC transporter substrate-binding protein [Streptomyces humicola]MCQ4083841.1 glycine betaine ABC transporter substrate-binding protein [Streptomyces humicola]